jgi:hypothetical protein
MIARSCIPHGEKYGAPVQIHFVTARQGRSSERFYTSTQACAQSIEDVSGYICTSMVPLRHSNFLKITVEL